MTDANATGGEIRPCLIGGFRGKIDTPAPVGLLPQRATGVARHNPMVSPDGSVASLDMLRLRLKFAGRDDYVARFEDSLQRLDTLAGSWSKRRSAPGQYAHLHTFEYGGSTVTLGVGQFVRGTRADMTRGFVEFNPNKVADGDGLGDFLRLVGSHVHGCELVRYDLAVDLPVDRARVRTRKDRRTYRFDQSAALTEYLGQRNSAGYVKVYDKAAEQGLDGVALTRVEMTCGGGWTLEQQRDHWPTVYVVNHADGDTSDANVALAQMAAELADMGGSPEKHIAKLNKRRRAKVRRLLEGATFAFPMEGAAHVLMDAVAWAGRIAAADEL